MKCIVLTLLALAALATADNILPTNNLMNGTNGTVPVPINVELPSSLVLELATCPVRDQIRFLNQILSIEYISQAYFSELNSQMNRVNSSTAHQLGVVTGASISEVKANVSEIVNHLNQVISWLNNTIRQNCATLPTDDQAECYVFTRCNYTFGNLTSNWTSNAAPAPTAAPVTNSSSSNSSSSNSSAPSNSSSSSSSNSTVDLSSVAPRAFRQGTAFSDRDTQFLISMVPLLTNVTHQQQIAYFAVMHGQHAAYLRALTGEGTQFRMAPRLDDADNANLLRRSVIRSDMLTYIRDQSCCDGFRGVRRV